MRAELETVSESVEDNTLGSITTSLNSFDPNICYNLFLHKYNIPLLHHSQTLYTFIQYLQHHNFTKPFKVSINPTYTETHVYTNYNDILLSNHILLTHHQYSTYYQLPLKSFSNCSTNNSLSKPTNQLSLSLCTHNVRGFNEDLKQQIWEDYCLSNNLNIISITETKIAANNPITKLQKSKHFTYLWSCADSSKAGTAIMIHKSIKTHIHKILLHSGYAIAVDLFFKHNFKFRIISVYLPCDDSQLRLQVQNTAIQWIQQAISLNIQPIVLGDFNASDNNIQSSSIKYKLLHFLQYNNMYNLAAYTQTSASTWQSNRYHSSIDYIWANQPLLRYLNNFTFDDPDTSTQSDHKILTSHWCFPHAYIGKL